MVHFGVSGWTVQLDSLRGPKRKSPQFRRLSRVTWAVRQFTCLTNVAFGNVPQLGSDASRLFTPSSACRSTHACSSCKSVAMQTLSMLERSYDNRNTWPSVHVISSSHSGSGGSIRLATSSFDNRTRTSFTPSTLARLHAPSPHNVRRITWYVYRLVIRSLTRCARTLRHTPHSRAPSARRFLALQAITDGISSPSCGTVPYKSCALA